MLCHRYLTLNETLLWVSCCETFHHLKSRYRAPFGTESLQAASGMAQSRATLASQPASAMQTTHQLQPARPQLNWLDLCDILCSTLRIIMPHSYTMPGTLCITGSSFVRKYARMDSTSNHPTISYIFPDKAFDRSCIMPFQAPSFSSSLSCRDEPPTRHEHVQHRRTPIVCTFFATSFFLP